MKFLEREFVVKGIFFYSFLFPGVLCAKKGDSSDEVPDYYPRVNPNPNNIEELNVHDIDQYFDLFTRFYEIDFLSDKNQNESYLTFVDNIKRVIVMNEFTLTAKYGINEFSHLTLKEFTDKYTGFNDTGIDKVGVKEFIYNSSNDNPPSLDWRVMGTDLIVRHQGACKSSYVFSALANIENQISKHYNMITILSEQQAYDCETSGNCKHGGMPHKVFQSIMDVGGIQAQDTYIYNPHDKRECKVNKTLMIVQITGIIRLKPAYEDGLLSLLALYGPLVTTIFVSESVKHYMKGVLTPTDCDQSPNHAVLLVGYGKTDDNIPYWLIKNSWGKLWGESGYMRLIRGSWACHIGEYVTTAVVKPTAAAAKLKMTTSETITSTSETLMKSTTESLNTTNNALSITNTTEKQKLGRVADNNESTSVSVENSDKTDDGIRTTGMGDQSPEVKKSKLKKKDKDVHLRRQSSDSEKSDKSSSDAKKSSEEKESSDEKQSSEEKKRKRKKKQKLRSQRGSSEEKQSSDEPKTLLTGVIEEDIERHARAESMEPRQHLLSKTEDPGEYKTVLTDKKVLRSGNIKKRSGKIKKKDKKASHASRSSEKSSEELKATARSTFGYVDKL